MITKDKLKDAVIKAFDKYPIPTTLGCTRAMMIATKAIDEVGECETCGGTVTIDETLGGESFSDTKARCPDCSGQSDKEADRLDELDEAIYGNEKAELKLIELRKQAKENTVLKIVQIIISPDNSAYQGALLGLGSDGVIYRAENDNKWHIYFPNSFTDEL